MTSKTCGADAVCLSFEKVRELPAIFSKNGRESVLANCRLTETSPALTVLDTSRLSRSPAVSVLPVRSKINGTGGGTKASVKGNGAAALEIDGRELVFVKRRFEIRSLLGLAFVMLKASRFSSTSPVRSTTNGSDAGGASRPTATPRSMWGFALERCLSTCFPSSFRTLRG